MKISCCSFNNKYSPPTMEITEREITSHKRQQTWKPNHPRHMSVRESQFHRSPGSIFHDGLAKPRTCHISCNKSEAFNILKYQLKDQHAKKAHLENMRQNLNRRLRKAQARGDQQLINLLNQESKQLESVL